ncbi:ribonuclease H [Senna tora]|uniref:Ribonuclease H n=1 Tax=Senna tora TaxID=362788 RepID=A0A834WV13_9FABA|nr:ribonuclease H [Senna tora]
MQRSEEILVSWEKANAGWVKVNSDGAVKHSIRFAGCGVIIRDEIGGWIGGVIRPLERYILLESDSKALVDGILQVENFGAEFSGLFSEICCILQEFIDFHVQHRWRQANLCADFLADLGVRCNGSCNVLVGPPTELSNLMIADVAGTSMPRFVHL